MMKWEVEWLELLKSLFDQGHNADEIHDALVARFRLTSLTVDDVKKKTYDLGKTKAWW